MHREGTKCKYLRVAPPFVAVIVAVTSGVDEVACEAWCCSKGHPVPSGKGYKGILQSLARAEAGQPVPVATSLSSLATAKVGQPVPCHLSPSEGVPIHVGVN